MVNVHDIYTSPGRIIEDGLFAAIWEVEQLAMKNAQSKSGLPHRVHMVFKMAAAKWRPHYVAFLTDHVVRSGVTQHVVKQQITSVDGG